MVSPISSQQFLYLHLDGTAPPAKTRETIRPTECETVALRCPTAADHAEAKSLRVCQLEDAFEVPAGT